MKTCERCEQPQPITHFKLHRGKRGNICRKCRNNAAKAKNRCPHCYKPLENNRCQHCGKRHKQRYQEIKKIVIEHYGGKCQCPGCQEDRLPFLTIDHKNGDGAEHRRKIPAARKRIYAWLLKENFPDDFQILCWNCNCAKSTDGHCPVHTQTAPPK